MGATSTRRTALVIVAKAPTPGAVKTRLCPPLTPAEAADLYRCLLLDTIDRVRALEGVTPALAYAPAGARRDFAALCPDFALLPQPAGDLGTRLAGTVQTLLAEGFSDVLAIGADAPTVPAALLRGAHALLGDPRIDVVVGPSEDGGYYLIGLKAAHPALFHGIPWSTPAVLDTTLRRAAATGLRVGALPQWHDVDTPEDLGRLRATLAGLDGQAAQRTRRFLAGYQAATTRFDIGVTRHEPAGR